MKRLATVLTLALVLPGAGIAAAHAAQPEPTGDVNQAPAATSPNEPAARTPGAPGDQPVEGLNWYHFRYDHEKQGPPLAFVFLNFLILLWILRRYGGPAVSQFLAQRHGAMKKLIDDARELKARAEARLREYEERLKNLDAEIQKIVGDLRAEAAAEEKRLIAVAEEEAARMRKDTAQVIASEIARVRGEIEREVATRALGLAEALVKKNLTDADDKQMLERYIADIGGTSRAAPVRATTSLEGVQS